MEHLRGCNGGRAGRATAFLHTAMERTGEMKRQRMILITAITFVAAFSGVVVEWAQRLENAELERMVIQEELTEKAQILETVVGDLEQKEEELKKAHEDLRKAKEELERQQELTSRGSMNLPTSELLDGFQVTWYNDYGVTKSGRTTVDGVTIAVDPQVIPLGTWLELILPDGTSLKRRADDTGGAVRGRIIDIYANRSTQELLTLGRLHGAKVRILKGDGNGG